MDGRVRRGEERRARGEERVGGGGGREGGGVLLLLLSVCGYKWHSGLTGGRKA